ncbi:hypothetical protein BROUX41_005961 [Berkeleyomyces rouxiae]|uniref:uncharacterized protein n=1 Tax=Berkeleyomyces rouxiae TaxID=2035830 RepID=UPI003B7B7434
MTTTEANNGSRNSAQISVLSSLWDEPTDVDMDLSLYSHSSHESSCCTETKTNNATALSNIDGTYEVPTPSKSAIGSTASIPSLALQVRKRPEGAASRAPSIKVTTSISTNDQIFNSPTTSIENLRRAAPGVRTRITSLENEVMRSKSPLDKLKDQSRRSQVRKLSQEYEAARSQWVRRTATELHPKVEKKPPGLRPLDSTLNVSIADDSHAFERTKALTVSYSLASATDVSNKAAPLSLITSVPAVSDSSRGDIIVSPVASSCYSVTVPETQSTVLEAKRQVSLMSNISQYNMGAALYGSPSRPVSRALYSKSSASGPMNSATESTDQSQWHSQPIHQPHEDGRTSRSSSHYTEGDDLRNSITRDSDYRNSGRYSAQWTELTELTIPSTEMDKNDDFNRLSLTFPENLNDTHDDTDTFTAQNSNFTTNQAEDPPATPKKSIFRAMFHRPKAIDLATSVHSHSRQRSSATAETAATQSYEINFNPVVSTGNQPRQSISMSTIKATAENTLTSSNYLRSKNNPPTNEEDISDVPRILGARHTQATSLEGQASELAYHHMEPTNGSSGHSLYGYMTPSQKLFHVFKKVSQPHKWKESRDKKRSDTEKTLSSQKSLASGYNSASTAAPVGIVAPSTTSSLVPTTVTIIESDNKSTEEEKRSRKKRSLLHSKASRFFGKDSKKRSKKPIERSVDTDFSNGLPVIPVTEAGELSAS